MTKDSTQNTSQDYDRKHGQDHVAHNPRAAKDLPSPQDRAAAATAPKANEFVDGPPTAGKDSLKSGYKEDLRETARHEHTNHFTNRASQDSK